MSVARIFSLLGDSNIRDHVNKNSIRANAALKSAQVLSCGHKGIFRETLAKVRAETSVCIVACVTNFLSSCEGSQTVSLRTEAVLQDFRGFTR